MVHRITTLPLLILSLLFAGCGDSSTGPEPEPGPDPPEDEIIINDDAYVVDPDQLSLTERTYNKLSFSFNGQAPDIETGDVVVGEENGGFLRRVAEISTQNNTLTLNTSEASLTDVIEKGEFQKTLNFSTDDFSTKAKRDSVTLYSTKWNVMQMNSCISVNNGEFNLDNCTLYEGGEDVANLKVIIPEGNIIFNPSIDLGGKIDNGIKEFHAIASGEITVVNDIKVTASNGIQLNDQIELAQIGKLFFVNMGPVPVVGRVTLSLITGFNVNTEVNGTILSGYTSKGTVEAGARYSDNSWSSIYEPDLSGESRPVKWEAIASANIRGYVQPRIDLTFYTVAGPYLTAEPYLRFEGNVTPPEWNWALYRGFNSDLGFKLEILSHELADFNKNLTSSETEIASANSEDTFTAVEVQSLECPSELEVDKEGTFSATINGDLARPPVTTTWEFGDGTTSNELETTKSYSSADTYTVTFTASNDGSEDSQECNVEVTEPANAPTINSINSSPNPSNTGETVNFSTDISGNEPIDCEWNFGNGATSTECNTPYTYQSTGTYEVSLKAINGGGTDTATLTHEVVQSGEEYTIYVSSVDYSSLLGASDPSYLYSVDISPQGKDNRLGQIKTNDGEEPAITDIASGESDELWGVSYEELYQINSKTAEAKYIGDTDFNGINALELDADGRLLGLTIDGELIQIDKQTGSSTIITELQDDWGSIGDITFGPDAVLFGIIGKDSDQNFLAIIDVNSGDVTPVNPGTDIGYENVFGLTYFADTFYAVTTTNNPDGGFLLEIDLSTGKGSIIRELDFHASGAGKAN